MDLLRKTLPGLLIASLSLSACVIDEATLREFESQMATEESIAATQDAASNAVDGPVATRTPRPTRVPAAQTSGEAGSRSPGR